VRTVVIITSIAALATAGAAAPVAHPPSPVRSPTPTAAAQDTTPRDTARRDTTRADGSKPKHSVGYNVTHSVKKAAKDTKNAAGTAGTNTAHEAKRAARNTRNEVHRDAERVSKATAPKKKPAQPDTTTAHP
jgi:hypothetical protein